MFQLSEMVGTTRPRVSLFMQRFHNLGPTYRLAFKHKRQLYYR